MFNPRSGLALSIKYITTLQWNNYCKIQTFIVTLKQIEWAWKGACLILRWRMLCHFFYFYGPDWVTHSQNATNTFFFCEPNDFQAIANFPRHSYIDYILVKVIRKWIQLYSSQFHKCATGMCHVFVHVFIFFCFYKTQK